MTDFLASSISTTFKDVVNAITRPWWLLAISVTLLVLVLMLYRRWTRPIVFWIIFGCFTLAYLGSLADENYRRIVGKPDNVPITLMVMSTIFFLWVAMRRAAVNDRHLEQNLPIPEEGPDDKVLVWPDLVYIELITMLLATAALTAWSILLKAPLEQPASQSLAPNPAKAPWYFLGLQEMLVYFDPWMAGVVYPGLIIFGLCAIPYLDPNPRGNGYYTIKERPFAIGAYLFGFLILWVLLIFLGTFLRGPNWSFFGPFERWDIHRMPNVQNVDLSNIWWNTILGRPRPMPADLQGWPRIVAVIYREWLGFLLVLGYFIVIPAILKRTAFKKIHPSMGSMRYTIMVVLLLFMLLMPIKMVLRWTMNLKYFIWLPEYSANF